MQSSLLAVFPRWRRPGATFSPERPVRAVARRSACRVHEINLGRAGGPRKPELRTRLRYITRHHGHFLRSRDAYLESRSTDQLTEYSGTTRPKRGSRAPVTGYHGVGPVFVRSILCGPEAYTPPPLIPGRVFQDPRHALQIVCTLRWQRGAIADERGPRAIVPGPWRGRPWGVEC